MREKKKRALKSDKKMTSKEKLTLSFVDPIAEKIGSQWHPKTITDLSRNELRNMKKELKTIELKKQLKEWFSKISDLIG